MAWLEQRRNWGWATRGPEARLSPLHFSAQATGSKAGQRQDNHVQPQNRQAAEEELECLCRRRVPWRGSRTAWLEGGERCHSRWWWWWWFSC